MLTTISFKSRSLCGEATKLGTYRIIRVSLTIVVTHPCLANIANFSLFVIPMFPLTWLDQEKLIHYKDEIAHGGQPTAFTLSVLDIKQPAFCHGDPEITEHWCLAHYLLDGHHKTYAAAQQNAPLNLVSFLAVDESLASEEEIKSALAALTP